MNQTPLAERLHIVLAGPRNAGKSSLMNALFQREVAIVSDVPGTTTDPVTRAFELPGVGAVAFTDTPGIDDEGTLGEQRVRMAVERAKNADIRLFVSPCHLPATSRESDFFQDWFIPCRQKGEATGQANNQKAGSTALLVLTHADKDLHPQKKAWVNEYSALLVDSPSRRGVPALIQALAFARVQPEPGPLDGLIREGDLVLLVTPIDLAAPAGRLIAPQVQTIRDALDRDASALLVKERELLSVYNNLKTHPKLVVTDSQAFSKVAADIPPDQPLTSFSILFARKKGDLSRFMAGIKAAIESKDAPKVLVLESCSHHRQADDIGTVKIPRLFRQLVHDQAEFSFERSLPDTDTLAGYDLVIHCGACRLTRTTMHERLKHLEKSNVAVTNYGIFLAWVNGLMPRAIEPFNDVYSEWMELFS